jgi:hypothetical protein
MAKNKMCSRCNKKSDHIRNVLYYGPSGYRRYAICDLCTIQIREKEIDKITKGIKNGNRKRVIK